MWFCGIELDSGESLYQVSFLSPTDEPVIFTLRLRAAWIYRGITKRMFTGYVRARGGVNFPCYSESQAYDRVHRIGQVTSTFR